MRCIAVAVAIVLVASARPAAGETSRDQAVARALDSQLEDTLAWQRLLHYPSDVDGSHESEVDGDAFFLSPRGKTSPRHELQASLVAFFAPDDRADQHARCRFPARYAFLAERLGLDEHVPEVRCPELDAFIARLQPEAVGLVYVGASVVHPASGVGHTFLSIGPRSDFGSAVEGKHAVDYTPIVTTSNPVSYVVAGISGAFDGQYRVVPFADTLDEYNRGDQRDIWQYELRLTRAEAKQVALHLWELRQATTTFYYLSENCAYHTLSLIDGAVPRFDLTSQTKHIVLPLDTIKAIPEDQVRGVTVFPSTDRRAREGIAPGSDAGDDHPAAGHAPFRFRFGTGITSRSPSPFAAVGLRLAFHDLADPPRGHAELTQVQLFDTVLHLDWAARSVYFDELTFMEMTTVHPMSAGDIAPSWSIRAIGMRAHDAGCPTGGCFVHGLNGGIGAAIATPGRAFTLFGIAEGWTLFGTELEGVADAGVRLGLGPHFGARLRIDDVVAVLGARWTLLPGQDPLHIYNATAQLRVPLAMDAALGIEGKLAPGDAQAVLWSFVYF